MTEPSCAHGTSGTVLPGDTVGADLGRAVAARPDRAALVDVPSGRREELSRREGELLSHHDILNNGRSAKSSSHHSPSRWSPTPPSASYARIARPG